MSPHKLLLADNRECALKCTFHTQAGDQWTIHWSLVKGNKTV